MFLYAAPQLWNFEYALFKVVWPNSDTLHENRPVLLFTSLKEEFQAPPKKWKSAATITVAADF